MYKYWLANNLFYAKSARPFGLKGGWLQQDPLKEHHDVSWAGHPGLERMIAMFSSHFYWADIGNEIEA